MGKLHVAASFFVDRTASGRQNRVEKMEEHNFLFCVFVCAGVPPPRMEWFKDAVPLSRLANPRYKVSSAAGLTVRRVQPGDGGIFQCVARNAAGEAQAYTHLLVSSESSHTQTWN